jgi:uncharacterized membrane protein YqiK
MSALPRFDEAKLTAARNCRAFDARRILARTNNKTGAAGKLTAVPPRGEKQPMSRFTLPFGSRAAVLVRTLHVVQCSRSCSASSNTASTRLSPEDAEFIAQWEGDGAATPSELDAEALAEIEQLVEGKFVDALRAVAAEMAMEELHEKRVDFVQKVQQVVSEDLLKNGLELESVSLTGLDQTGFEHFNPQNAFDAEGLTRLTEAIESRRKKRNDIEQDTQVQIATKNLQAEREKLQIGREEEYARLEQEREIETRRAAQMAEIASQRANQKREADEATIAAQRQVDLSQVAAERDVEEQRIQKARAVETAEIERRKSVELSEQDRAIAIAERSKAQSEAQAEADRARAIAVKEEEAVLTVREVEQADRHKAVELVKARQEAEQSAIAITVAAEAEKQAADDQAAAVRTLADGEAAKVRIAAQGEADAEVMRADAAAKRYAVEAEGKRAMNDAANLLSDEQIAMQIRMALIEYLPEIIRESVKPMEKIDGMKIIQVDGLTGGGANGAGAGGGGSMADQLVSSALRYRAQSPLVDALLQEIGLDGGDLNGLTKAFQPMEESAPVGDGAKAARSADAKLTKGRAGEKPPKTTAAGKPPNVE